MKRLFQHYKGAIDSLSGTRFSCVKTIDELSTDDVVLIWLQDAASCNWYRIFIDGAYCGIDLYPEDGSDEDVDDGYVCTDRSEWFLGKTLTAASVELINKTDTHIVLNMDFGKHECKYVCRNEDGECELQFSV